MRLDIVSEPVCEGRTAYRYGATVMVFPSPDPGYSPRERDGYDRQVESILVGACRCGALAEMVAPGCVEFDHADDCTALLVDPGYEKRRTDA